MRVNFYWSGQVWRLPNRLTIASHIKVGHEVVMWVGEKPENDLWVDDMAVEFHDAPRPPKGVKRPQIYSDYISFEKMKENGECWADCDAVALREWPDQEWLVIPNNERRYASLGVLRVPKGHPVNDYVMDNHRLKKSNTKVFEEALKLHNIPQTHEGRLFYPVNCIDSLKMRGACNRNLEVSDDTYSFHFYRKSRIPKVPKKGSYYEQLCERFL